MVSIIIPAYNEEQFISHLLETIKQQTYKDIEIIVVDNHSQDKTRAAAKKYGARVVDGGIPSVARNRGAEVARGRYFLFVDADQELPPSFVARMVARVRKNKLDICVPRLKPLHEKGVAYVLLFKLHAIYLRLMQYIKPQGSGACIFATRMLHNSIGGFDESRRLSEDHDYILLAARVGKYRVLRDMHVNFSVRRIHEEGLLLSLYKITKAAMLHIFTGKADEKVEYEFGNFRHNYAASRKRVVETKLKPSFTVFVSQIISRFARKLSYLRNRKDV
jgi:glycosyltransferase involved in cell wall biosynthesis